MPMAAHGDSFRFWFRRTDWPIDGAGIAAIKCTINLFNCRWLWFQSNLAGRKPTADHLWMKNNGWDSIGCLEEWLYYKRKVEGTRPITLIFQRSRKVWSHLRLTCGNKKFVRAPRCSNLTKNIFNKHEQTPNSTVFTTTLRLGAYGSPKCLIIVHVAVVAVVVAHRHAVRCGAVLNITCSPCEKRECQCSQSMRRGSETRTKTN